MYRSTFPRLETVDQLFYIRVSKPFKLQYIRAINCTACKHMIHISTLRKSRSIHFPKHVPVHFSKSGSAYFLKNAGMSFPIRSTCIWAKVHRLERSGATPPTPPHRPRDTWAKAYFRRQKVDFQFFQTLGRSIFPKSVPVHFLEKWIDPLSKKCTGPLVGNSCSIHFSKTCTGPLFENVALSTFRNSGSAQPGCGNAD